jgi:hypothetical protein
MFFAGVVDTGWKIYTDSVNTCCKPLVTLKLAVTSFPRSLIVVKICHRYERRRQNIYWRCTRVESEPVVHSDCPHLCEKFKTALIGNSGDRRKMIRKKNLKPKISWHCHFNSSAAKWGRMKIEKIYFTYSLMHVCLNNIQRKETKNCGTKQLRIKELFIFFFGGGGWVPHNTLQVSWCQAQEQLSHKSM